MDASSSDDEPVVAVEDDAPAPEETDLVWETLTDDGGVKKATTRKALGVPKYPDPGMELKVHYTGTVPGEAEPFDCSRKRKTAFTFELGGGSVISGWDVAFQRVRRPARGSADASRRRRRRGPAAAREPGSFPRRRVVAAPRRLAE